MQYLLLFFAGLAVAFGALGLVTRPTRDSRPFGYDVAAVSCLVLGALSLLLVSWWPLFLLIAVFLLMGIIQWSRGTSEAGTRASFVDLLPEVAQKAEDQYRAMLDILSEEQGQTPPAPEGVLLARFFAMTFVIGAHVLRWPDDPAVPFRPRCTISDKE